MSARAVIFDVDGTLVDSNDAAKAEVPAIAFRCGGWGDADLAGARAIYEDAADLLSRYTPTIFGKAPA